MGEKTAVALGVVGVVGVLVHPITRAHLGLGTQDALVRRDQVATLRSAQYALRSARRPRPPRIVTIGQQVSLSLPERVSLKR